MAPEMSVVMNATTIVKSNTCGSRRISMKNGICWARPWMTRLNAPTPTYATPIPNIVAARERMRASARNCRTIAEREAPSAVRTPTSFVRCAARSSSRLATLAQAISSTKKTAPSIV